MGEEGKYISTSKVTTLQHKLRNDTVERRALVTLLLGLLAQLAEVGGGLGNVGLEEVEDDAGGFGWLISSVYATCLPLQEELPTRAGTHRGILHVEESLGVGHGG